MGMQTRTKIPIWTIGTIQTPFLTTENMPIQASRSDATGTVEVFPEYVEGLEGVEEFSHLILLYGFHQAPVQAPLKVKPFLDNHEHGIFATRFPHRPNPIGLSVVRLVSCMGNILEVQVVDMLDGTPLLDIKPYVPDFDIHPASKTGWYANRAHP
jgi:tRNA (adenine37-N6)-methyltransferase